MIGNEIRFIRFANGTDIITEVVSQTKTTIIIKSAMTLITDVDIEGGKQSLIMYPWFPHGVILSNEVKLNKKDIMWIDDIEEDIKDYYVENCLEVFGENQKMVSTHIAGAKSAANPNSNVLEFNGFVRNKIKNIGNTSI